MSEDIGDHFDRLRGRILGLIESWGLPPVQERGCKSIFKSLTYDMEREITELAESRACHCGGACACKEQRGN